MGGACICVTIYSMDILILGGTVFLGRYLVTAARDAGHTVTLFNRGKSNPDLYPDIERLVGDRDGGLDVLRGRRWDAVIDTRGYVPRLVRDSAELLKDAIGHYTFISTISVYSTFDKTDINEQDPVGRLDDETVEQITGETYGPLKALCEEAVEVVLPGRTLNIRPSLIVGPHDPTDRFAYWPYRTAQGGNVVAPGRQESKLQFIDVRDLAEWTIRMVEAGGTGVYNATGPDPPVAMQDLLEAFVSVSGSGARFVWMNDDFLIENEIQPFVELPLWIPDNKTHVGFYAVNCVRAIASGLTFRSLADTVEATLAWNRTRSNENAWQATLTREKEQVLLDKWKK